MSSKERGRRWMLVLCYMALFGLIPLLVEKRRRDIRWHAKNGLLLFAAVVAFGIVATAIGALLPSLSCVSIAVTLLVGSVYVVVAILATVKALQGERLIVPGISRYADRF